MDNETASKVQAIIENQFNREIAYKQSEVELINERIYLTKHVLNRLRVAIIAKYFATPEMVDDETAWSNTLDNCVHPTVRSYFGGKTVPLEINEENGIRATYDLPAKLSRATLLKKEASAKASTVKSLQSVRFIIGNVSRYIGCDDPENRVTHLWMAYVRLHPDSSEKIEELVSKVRFFLHPSYAPHDVIEVSYPFHLKRKGWGEFQLRAQIHFIDPLNKPADVLHELKLDQHKRGIQTNGGETHLELKLLVERAVESSSDDDSEPSAMDSVNIKQEIVDEVENKEPEPIQRPQQERSAPDSLRGAEIQVRRHFPPNYVDLEAHGHDYCFPAPFLLVASGSAMPRENPPGVRIMRGESLLKSKSYLHNSRMAQVVTPWLEAVSRWEQGLKSLDFTQDAFALVDILASRLFQLVGHKSIGDLSFQVRSVEEFLGFPLVKQRAIEWFRASHIRRILLKNGVSAVPTTRSIVLHLRKHGFTPLHDSSNLVGVHVDQTFDSFSLVKLPVGVELMEVSNVRKKIETSCEIDVLGSGSEDDAPNSTNRVAWPLLGFVHDVMRQVLDESSLPDDEEQLENMLVLMLGALKSFSLKLLRTSLAQSFKRNDSTYQVDGILPSDIHRAVTSTELFDFLSNVGLGTVLQ